MKHIFEYLFSKKSDLDKIKTRYYIIFPFGEDQYYMDDKIRHNIGEIFRCPEDSWSFYLVSQREEFNHAWIDNNTAVWETTDDPNTIKKDFKSIVKDDMGSSDIIKEISKKYEVLKKGKF